MKLKKHLWQIIKTKILIFLGHYPENLRQAFPIEKNRVYNNFGYWILVEGMTEEEKEHIHYLEDHPEEITVRHASCARCSLCEMFHAGIPCPVNDEGACSYYKFTIIKRNGLQ